MAGESVPEDHARMALGNVETCLKMDEDRGLHWASVPAYSLRIVVAELTRLRALEEALKGVTKSS